MSDTPPAAGQGQARRISDWVAEQLLGRISRGELVPGERLPGERQLAEQLHVSRVSVRAALQRLKTQGLLTAVQGGGTRVVSSASAMDAALTAMIRSQLDNLLDLLEIRMALESWAARRAAERATPEQIEAMGRALADLSSAGDGHGHASGDMDFHLEIARAAGSPVYLHILATIRDILDQMVDFNRPESLVHGQEGLMRGHHRAIFDAIASRDPDAAAAAVSAHLYWVLRRYEELRNQAGGR